MYKNKRRLQQSSKKLESPNQQEQLVQETEEDILKRYNGSYYEFYCNYLFPQAIEYGMSAEEFWKDDPQLFVSYRTSFINKKKREMEEYDYKCWLQGLYVHDGNGKLFNSLKQFLHNMIAGMFKGQKDNTKIETYPVKPYNELKKENELKNRAIKRKETYKEFENSLVYFGTLKQQYIDKLKLKGR